MKILLIDFMNAIHIANSGFKEGDHFLMYNFFRNMKALIELHVPDRVAIVLEGSSKHRHALSHDYKANRKPTNDFEQQKRNDFFECAQEIKELIEDTLPISIMHHASHEADDTIFNCIVNASTITDWIVSSTDTDFIQLLQQFDNVKLWNPVKKIFVEAPDYDYITWKSMRGDKSDNILGIPGFGDVKASKYARDPALLTTFTAEQKEIFELNKSLIRFYRCSNEELMLVGGSVPTLDFEKLAVAFHARAFNSILKEPYWTKFKRVFQKLAI
jgi:5'-3' exonuclease